MRILPTRIHGNTDYLMGVLLTPVALPPSRWWCRDFGFGRPRSRGHPLGVGD